jgi:hypothetical protein
MSSFRRTLVNQAPLGRDRALHNPAPGSRRHLCKRAPPHDPTLWLAQETVTIQQRPAKKESEAFDRFGHRLAIQGLKRTRLRVGADIIFRSVGVPGPQSLQQIFVEGRVSLPFEVRREAFANRNNGSPRWLTASGQFSQVSLSGSSSQSPN